MNILVDFVTACFKSGAGEYLRRVLVELIDRIQREKLSDVRLFALYDSSVGIAYDDLSESSMRVRCGTIPISFVDCHRQNIAQVVEQYRIDVFFIACAQYVGGRNGIQNVKCRVVMTIHDVFGEDVVDNRLREFCWITCGSYDYKKRFRLELLNIIRHVRLAFKFASRVKANIAVGSEYGGPNSFLKLQPAIELANANKDVQIVVDSQYSFKALEYHFGKFNAQKVTTLYPPDRVYSDTDDNIEDPKLREILAAGRKYFLIVSANREFKNAIKAVTVFGRFQEFNKDIDLVAVGYKVGHTDSNRIITLPMLSDGDLKQAYAHCHALLYPSLIEGFGYPPLEAMKHGKPVLCSNVTSIPEILGEAPIYFSPFYNTDIFKAMMSLTEEEYDMRSQKSLERYRVVHNRQERDLQQLLDLILGV